MDDQQHPLSPPKTRLSGTPLRRMNTVSGLHDRSTNNRRKHSSLAALYTPQDHLKVQPQQQQQQGYRKLSIGSKLSPLSLPSSAPPKKRISGINFNIPVVAADKEPPLIRSSSSSPQQQQQQQSPIVSERHSSVESMPPSPSPLGYVRAVSDDTLKHSPSTPTAPSQKQFEPLPQQQQHEDVLSLQLRELAAKELELLEIKETIKGLVNKKRTMEMEFEVLKKSVERSLHQQINPTTTARRSYPLIPSPKTMRSPIKSFQQQQHRAVSDHPLDDNFNSVAPSSTTPIAAAHQVHDKRSKRQSGIWGIISQVDNYIQSEFEKFNIIDLNPANDHHQHHRQQHGGADELNSSYYLISDNHDLPSEENRIKKLLDANNSNGLQIPQSLRNVVDSVIYGPTTTIKEEEEEQPGVVKRPDVVRNSSKKSVEMKDFSFSATKPKRQPNTTTTDDDVDDEWAKDFEFE